VGLRPTWLIIVVCVAQGRSSRVAFGAAFS